MSISPIGNDTAVHYVTPQPITPDSQLVLKINKILYSQFGQPIKNMIFEFLSNEEIGRALDLFERIQSRSSKIEAFASAISSDKGFNYLHASPARQFYDALSVDLQNEFKHQLWIANNRSDNGLGLNFGQHVVDTALPNNENNALAKQAVRAMRSSHT
jgi:hypothetical protein